MKPKEFATQITSQLQSAGFEALWAGGCVRDALLGRVPKDYDVATSATPDQVRELFGFKRTLPIGAAFGVITVIGPKSAGAIEVATFRRDGGYSDGRRPDSVEFTDAKEDALRRDFTINGMFFDPVAQQVIDYVGGQADLSKKQIRAIGNPDQRIEEDKLRMLRGVRFAATYDFTIEPVTLSAIQRRCSEIDAVSPERIGAELTRMLNHDHFLNAAKLLVESNLLDQVVPKSLTNQGSSWQSAIERLARLTVEERGGHQPNGNRLAAVLTLLLLDYFPDHRSMKRDRRILPRFLEQIKEVWRLKNELVDAMGWIYQSHPVFATADRQRWSVVQPWLIGQHAATACKVADVMAPGNLGTAYCRERLVWDPEELNPNPLLSGQDLIELGIQPGPHFKSILKTVRDQQLDGQIASQEQAITLARSLIR